jgi:transcriptional regulator with XRE-family HTH domain
MHDFGFLKQETCAMSKEPTDARSRFAQRLRAIRIPRGFKTARSFARALGIDENRYTRYERAEVEPDLQLLLRMCELLRATPNDLLCDTIGSTPIDSRMPYGFSDAPAANFEPSTQPRTAPADDERKAIAWQLAETVALIKAHRHGATSNELSAIEKLRLIGPLFARVNADPFSFLASLPNELDGIAVETEAEARIGQLSEKLLAAHAA